MRALLRKEECSACPAPCPAPPLEESDTGTWSSKVPEQAGVHKRPLFFPRQGRSQSSCLCDSVQFFAGVGLCTDLLSSVKNQFYMILLFSKVFFLSGELLILTKKLMSILAFHVWF